MTESNSHVSVCLEITEELPSEVALLRWLAEPIKVTQQHAVLLLPLLRRLLLMLLLSMLSLQLA